MILVNGPIARKLGINATNNVFGPGQRAHAGSDGLCDWCCSTACATGRASPTARPLGTPGKYTCCIAENEEDHPWQPWHVEQGFRSEESTVCARRPGLPVNLPVESRISLDHIRGPDPRMPWPYEPFNSFTGPGSSAAEIPVAEVMPRDLVKHAATCIVAEAHKTALRSLVPDELELLARRG